ncbi:MAG: type VI secretion system protein TssA [Planctomycetota bacterium]|nr:type VI secretion system protein TssA [Planctomycetota bacterium]
MGVDVQALLKPISPDAPGGEDLRYDRRYLEVLRLSEGTVPEGMVDSGAEPAEPSWREVRDGCLEMLARSRDLRMGVLLSLSSMRLEGLAGLRDGLAVIRGYLETLWDDCHPKLDPDDGNDPTERSNIVGGMSMPPSSFGDPLQFLTRLRECPLCESRQTGRFSLKDIMIAGGELPPDPPAADGTPKPVPSINLIDGAFEETDLEVLQQLSSAADDALAHATAIDAAFTAKVKAGQGPDMTALKTMLKDIATQVKRRLNKRIGEPEPLVGGGAGSGASSGGGGGGGGAPRQRLEGEITSGQDVLIALKKIIAYYEKAEPSSPVPLVAKCAEVLVGKSFMEIQKVLTPDAVGVLERISTPEQPAATS